ncbi:hypothetical protein [Flagellimonas pacifica]|uniref:BZIP transcription factor n=1 Tax=Flagellimonas pacifica TaxID=1247520 RepID=A0A285MTP2_9FLAO|nr:hypothetical protein [Allomuricauda parva]SNZ00570.1 hypothetical protein SAMN06265377_2394 [Allomuricauda parva]
MIKKSTLFVLPIFLFLSIWTYGQNLFPASGNVGIGTLSPSYDLEVAGTLNATSILLDGAALEAPIWNLNANEAFYNNGNVGIGTNDPNFTLDVAGTLNATSILLNGAALGTPIWSLNANEAFYNNGNVGIGTNDPNFTLDVAGTLNATSILLNGTALQTPIWSLNANEAFYNGGNVGIGTNDPNFLLDVNGSLNATNIFLNGFAVQSSQWTTAGNDISYSTGNVGIGTANTQGYMLAVAGNVIAEGVKVELEGNWPDFVFGEEFNLMSLEEVSKFIGKNRHLPNIPSAKNVEENGIDLGIMDAKLLQKIEELTLYTIQQQKEIDSLKNTNKKLIEQNQLIKKLSNRLDKIENSRKE